MAGFPGPGAGSFEALVTTGTEAQGALAGSFQRLLAVALAQAQDAQAGVEALHGAGRQTHLQLLLHQLVGHRVVMPVDLDVVVDVHPSLLPLGIDVGLLRQRAQGRAIQAVEGRLSGARQLLERPLVEPL